MPRLELTPEIEDEHLDALRRALEGGDPAAIFRAIGFCGNQQLAMPEWLVQAYYQRMNRWWSLEVKTLDEAFGIRYRKGAHLAAARKKWRLQFSILNDVRASGRAQSPELFAEIGKRYGVGKTLAYEYYKSASKILADAPPAFKALLTTYMTTDAKAKASTRKIAKLRGKR